MKIAWIKTEPSGTESEWVSVIKCSLNFIKTFINHNNGGNMDSKLKALKQTKYEMSNISCKVNRLFIIVCINILLVLIQLILLAINMGESCI